MKDHTFFALFKNSGISEKYAGRQRERGGERDRESCSGLILTG